MTNPIIKERAVLIDIVDLGTDPAEYNLRLEELDSLVKTYGGVSVLKAYQKRSKPAYQTYVGTGKVDELFKELDGGDNIDLVIVNNILKPKQIYNLEEHLLEQETARLKEAERNETPKKIKVWDRVDLILKIFDKHATTAEAKLQIELASIKHMGPRIFGMGMELSRQAGGIGTVGVGETNTEIMKRHLQKRTKLVEDKIKSYGEIQRRQRETRRDRKQKTVALAGYTNAGKSTLIKALTKKKDVYIADELFATLDSKVGELFIPTNITSRVENCSDARHASHEDAELTKTSMSSPSDEHNTAADNFRYGSKVMIADTIGFIQDLPPSLIQAFKTTLAEIVDADLILHVIDINDPDIHLKIRVVEGILDELLKGKDTQKIYVFNKVDLLKNKPWSEDDKQNYIAGLLDKYARYSPQIVSALDAQGLNELINIIAKLTLPSAPQTNQAAS
jgi:GTP-binding protein HflX